jgi:uncharacterized protein
MTAIDRRARVPCSIAFFLLAFTACAQTVFYERLAEAAVELTKQPVRYDPAYFSIAYPGGDVPADRGVCTDVVIRAYRTLNIDLQRLVHEDMKANFEKYPQHWGLKKPDRNIDHRRVPNLKTFFSRYGKTLPVTREGKDYYAGDVVTWELSRGVPHIGIIIGQRSADGARPLVVHNVGNGQEISDCLFQYKITGHYRYGD